MPLIDGTVEEIRAARLEQPEPDDFDSFWADTLSDSRSSGRAPTMTAVRTPYRELLVHDLTFSGFNGEPIKAWVASAPTRRNLGTVIEYVGYGGGRGLPGENPHWALAGYNHVIMDSRGQGGVWGSGGETPDRHPIGPTTSGPITWGLHSPESYYYRRFFTDAVRLVDAVIDSGIAAHPAEIAVTGHSQGGAAALAVAGLAGGLRAVMPNVPFLCDIHRSIKRVDTQPYVDVARYLSVNRRSVDIVLRTLSYFDCALFARRSSASAQFSVAMMDDIVPPRGVFAAFNEYSGADKSISVYEFNGHEGGGMHHWMLQADWLATRLRAAHLPAAGPELENRSA